MNGDCPAARPFGVVMEYKNDLYISTSPNKEVCKQLKANGNIQLVATKHGTRNWVRVTGQAYECKNLGIKKIMLVEYPELLKHFNSEKS